MAKITKNFTEAELEAKVDSLKGSGYYADSKENER